ncbi:MAG: hypothetical protein H7A20_07410 [Rhodanobacteraceae bacterium]|nr:hypothetical protein [Rhodanobacteraceae bacterium]
MKVADTITTLSRNKTLLLTLVACTVVACNPSDPAPSAPKSLDALETGAVFWELLKPSERPLPHEFVACLRVGEADPSPETMAMLARPDEAVYRASECTMQTQEPGSYHNVSGRKAMFYTVYDFQRVRKTKGVIRYSLFHHGLYGAGGECDLHFDDGRWKVDACHQSHVS